MSNLGILTLYSIKDRLVGALVEARVYSSLPIILESLTEPFGAIVEGISEGLVDALQGVSAGHKNLHKLVLGILYICSQLGGTDPLKRCGASPWMGRHKYRFVRHRVE